MLPRNRELHHWHHPKKKNLGFNITFSSKHTKIKIPQSPLSFFTKKKKAKRKNEKEKEGKTESTNTSAMHCQKINIKQDTNNNKRMCERIKRTYSRRKYSLQYLFYIYCFTQHLNFFYLFRIYTTSIINKN